MDLILFNNTVSTMYLHRAEAYSLTVV